MAVAVCAGSPNGVLAMLVAAPAAALPQPCTCLCLGGQAHTVCDSAALARGADDACGADVTCGVAADGAAPAEVPLQPPGDDVYDCRATLAKPAKGRGPAMPVMVCHVRPT